MSTEYDITVGTRNYEGKKRKSITMTQGNINIVILDTDGKKGLTGGDKIIYMNQDNQQVRNIKVDIGALNNLLANIPQNAEFNMDVISYERVRSTDTKIDPTNYEYKGLIGKLSSVDAIKTAYENITKNTNNANGANGNNGTNVTNNNGPVAPIPAGVNRTDFLELSKKHQNLNTKIGWLTKAKTYLNEIAQNPATSWLVPFKLMEFMQGAGGYAIDQVEAMLKKELDGLKSDAQAKGINMTDLDAYTAAIENGSRPATAQASIATPANTTPVSSTGVTAVEDASDKVGTTDKTTVVSSTDETEETGNVDSEDRSSSVMTTEELEKILRQLPKDIATASALQKKIQDALIETNNPEYTKMLSKALSELQTKIDEYKNTRDKDRLIGECDDERLALEKQVQIIQTMAENPPEENFDKQKYEKDVTSIIEDEQKCKKRLENEFANKPKINRDLYSNLITEIKNDKSLTVSKKAEKMKALAQRKELPKTDEQIKDSAHKAMKKAKDETGCTEFTKERNQVRDYILGLPEDEQAKAIAYILDKAGDGAGTDAMPFDAAIYALKELDSKAVLDAVNAHLVKINSTEKTVKDWIDSEYSMLYGNSGLDKRKADKFFKIIADLEAKER